MTVNKDFILDDEHKQIQKMVRDFAQNEVAPKAEEIDQQKRFPSEIIEQMAELDLFALPFEEEYGGADAGYLSYAIAVEEISRACASTGITFAAHCSIGCGPIHYFGTHEQKKKWLEPGANGEMLLAFGLTEPGAGSDAGATRTTAVLDGDEWVINGNKCFITNSSRAGAVVITARTEDDKTHKGISSIVVPTDAPGYSVGQPYEKMGWHGSDTNEIILDNVRVPKENILGNRGEGFKQFMKVLDGGRISIAAMSLGIAQACLDESVKYAQEREQFGRPISKFQSIQNKIADMAMQVELSRLATYQAAWLKDNGYNFTKEAAMAKLYASETSVRAALDAIQIHGGYGYIKEYPVERHLRDAKILEIGEGTSEIQRLVIARQVGC